MKTVKEVSRLTGISARTLHYYDEIGLLRPAQKSEAGYRLYDDKALERLQQILFFREFEIPLKQIGSILDDPAFDKKRILQIQREMLLAKKERMERLVAEIDTILKGADEMDLAVFNKNELREMFREMLDRMPGSFRAAAAGEFGGEEQWREHYLKAASAPEAQKRYAKMAEWYGGKEAYRAAAQNPPGRAAVEGCQKRMDAVLQKLLQRRGSSPDSFAVKECVGEYGFIMKQLCQVKDEAGAMLALAKSYRDERAKRLFDGQHGDGAAEFIADAIEAFYL